MQAKMSEQQLYMQLREKGIHDVKEFTASYSGTEWSYWLSINKRSTTNNFRNVRKSIRSVQYKKIISREKKPIL